MDKRAIQAGIWLVGIGILFWMNWWWPGILILVGISMLVSVLFPGAPKPETPAEAGRYEEPAENWEDESIPPPLGEIQVEQPIKEIHNPEKLPESCPMCGGPVLKYLEELEWTSTDTARCPYCSTELPLPDIQGNSGAEADLE